MSNCKYCILTKEKMKELNRKNWTLTLSGSNGAGTSGSTLALTDDSAYTAATASPVGNRYNIISS